MTKLESSRVSVRNKARLERSRGSPGKQGLAGMTEEAGPQECQSQAGTDIPGAGWSWEGR